MQQLMFVIYDDKAKAYLPPFYLPTKEMAQRTFSDCINDNQHAFGAHPEDYTLFHLGGFDNITAETITTKEPHLIGNGLIFKTQQQTPVFDPQDVENANTQLNQQFHKTNGPQT